MNNNENLDPFFIAWSKLDYKGIMACYAQSFVYNNPLVGVLPYEIAIEYWRMRCEKTKELTITYGDCTWTDDEYVTCPWQAGFIYYGNGKKVVVKGKAFLRVQNGLITEHSDGFKLGDWLKQVYGWQGTLFSFTGMMKRKAIHLEQQILDEYIGVV